MSKSPDCSPVKNGIRLNKRAPIWRIAYIHSAVAQGLFPNAFSLAKVFEVSNKTVSRDICFMKDMLHLPLVLDRSRNGFFYEGAVQPFLDILMTANPLAKQPSPGSLL